MMEDMRREMPLNIEFEPHYLDVDGTQALFDANRPRVIVPISLIWLCDADGTFEIEEQSFLNVLCRLFEISDSEFVLIENRARRLIALKREANAFL